jgi:hypothetical protein
MNLVNPEVLSQVLKSEKNNKGGRFTVRSKSTGKDFTYQISRSQFRDKWYTQVYIETQYLSFKHLGVFKSEGVFKAGVPVTTPAAMGIGWLLKNVEKGRVAAIASQADIYHTGKCLKCGKELTDANSIEIGLGPVCRGY